MDGADLILKVKSEKNLARIPFIGITGAYVGRAKAEILNNFSIPVLSKPWDESELLDRVTGAFLGSALLARGVTAVAGVRR
jgi:response regulator RpfG family c-di-GMP phosphodiesterase